MKSWHTSFVFQAEKMSNLRLDQYSDPDFAKSLLHEAVDLLLNGDSATAKLILRDLINATVGFEKLAEEVQKPSKSLHRMLSTSGNPTMENLSAIFATIKKELHVRIDTTVTAV